MVSKTRTLGRRLLRPDAVDKVTGRARFPGDLVMEGALAMKVLFSSQVHARIVSIDNSEAEKVPGVVAILTHRDVPVNEYGLIYKDQPALNGDKVRSLFDRVALVIAETQQIAQQACDLIRVEYEPLPLLTDPRESMKPGAVTIHDTWPDNVQSHQRIRKGDVDAVFARDDVVIIESDYFTPHQEHAYLQPEAGIGFIDEEGRVAVHSAGQWNHDDQHQIAHMLDLPLDQVRVIYAPAGGAFGGREDMSVQHLLALAALAWKSGASGGRSRSYGIGRSRSAGITSAIPTTCTSRVRRARMASCWPSRRPSSPTLGRTALRAQRC